MPTIPTVTITNRSINSLTATINNLIPDGVDCIGAYTSGTITKRSNGIVLIEGTAIPNGAGLLVVNITTGSMNDEILDLTLSTLEGADCFGFSFQSTAYVPTLESIFSLKKTIFSKITRGLSYNPRQSQRKKFPTI
jgi:hypothetical protein